MRKVLRLFRIILLVIFNGLDQLILTGFKAPSKWLGIRLNKDHRADRLVKTLIKLGPLFIKFGQILSTRRDLMPLDISNALATLQDKVPPFEFKYVEKTLMKHFGDQFKHVFTQIDENPLGSASIAQVHAAKLHDGNEVVIKLLRPNIKRIVAKDIKLLYALAKIITWSNKDFKRLHLVAVVDEIHQTLQNELNLLNEAANGAQLRRNFLVSTKMYVPEMFWDYCFKDLITMERVRGVPINQTETLVEANTNMARLSERGTEIFLQQVFEDNFFHADMHPGNLFVDVSNPAYPKYIGVDFGICGSLSPEDQRYIAENLVAFFQQDYLKIAQLHIDSGWVPESTNAQHFANQIRRVCEPIINRPIKEISFGKLLDGLITTARSFNMEVQPQLLLLQKTIFNIEGLGRDLYPDMNLWDQAKPFLENWVKKQKNPVYHLPQYLERISEYLHKDMTHTATQTQTEAVITEKPRKGIATLALIGASTGIIGLSFSIEAQNLWVLSLTLIQVLILWQR